MPEQIPTDQAEGILAELSELTGLSVEEIQELSGQADPSWFVPIKDFPEGEKDRLLDIISRLPGVSVKSETARVYPLGERAAHITGYISEPTAEQIAANPALIPGQPIGQAGIEAGADEILAGIPTVVYGFFAALTVGPLFRALDPEKVNSIAQSLITIFQGQGGTINDILDQTASLTSARKSGSLRVASSAENSTSSTKRRARPLSMKRESHEPTPIAKR